MLGALVSDCERMRCTSRTTPNLPLRLRINTRASRGDDGGTHTAAPALRPSMLCASGLSDGEHGSSIHAEKN